MDPSSTRKTFRCVTTSFNDNVASYIAEDIVLGCNVEEIDYTENETKVTCDNEETYKARYVVVIDIMFDGEASENYVGHVFQNRSDEPYVQTGCTRWVNDVYQSIGTFQKPLDSKVIFAGESLPVDRESWGYAHGAALSGKQAAKVLLGLDADDSSGGETPSGICGVILYIISLFAGLLGWS